MNYPKILITGAQGRIGRILTRSLADSFDVYGLDVVEGQTEKQYRADVSDYKGLNQVFVKIGNIKYVIHLAADPGVNAEWESVLKNNIIGTRNVYEAARHHGVRKVILASTAYVTAGYERVHPEVDEQEHRRRLSPLDPIRPETDYGTSKAFGEAIARQYFERFGIASICLRIGWVVKDDDPTANPALMRRWLSYRDLVQLFTKSLLSEVKFGIYYGVSNNTGGIWDISNATKELGYEPQDDSSFTK